MIGLPVLYVLAGLLFAVFAIGSATDRTNPKRWGNAVFWGLFAVSFLAGTWLSDTVNGLLLVAMALAAGFNLLGKGQPAPQTDRAERAQRWGNRLFVPALIPPAVTLAGTFLLKGVEIGGQPLVDPKQVTLVSLGLGIVLATVAALVMFRASPAVARCSKGILDQLIRRRASPRTKGPVASMRKIPGDMEPATKASHGSREKGPMMTGS